MLVSIVLAGLSAKFAFPLKSNVTLEFDIKGVVLMGIMAATSCLASFAGVCEGCRQRRERLKVETMIYGVIHCGVQFLAPSPK